MNRFRPSASFLRRSVCFVSIVTWVSASADDAVVPAGTVTQSAATTATGLGTGSMLVPFAAMFAIMYFLMIRPQQKRMKEQQAMLSALKVGDEVLTASGILGKVKELSDKIVTLEIDRDVSIRVLKSQVGQVLTGGFPEKLA